MNDEFEKDLEGSGTILEFVWRDQEEQQNISFSLAGLQAEARIRPVHNKNLGR
jgi:hypothetical protein